MDRGSAGRAQRVVASAVGAAAGWRAARRRDATEREQLEAALTETERSLQRAREAAERLHQSWEAERAWGRDLRSQLHDLLARGRTTTREGDDVHVLVLRAAIELVGAEKGALLSRRDENGDGELDMIVARGFEHDPTHSALAQRFAREVLARDEIVREDEPSAPDDERAPADDEIDTLVAIPLYLRDRFQGVVVCVNRPGGFEQVGDEVLLALGDHAGAALHHGRLHREVSEAHRAVVRVLLETLAAREPQLERESAELAVRAVTLARDLELDDRQRDALVIATMLRGVGQLALPDQVFAKSGPLSDEQRAIVQMHPRLGFTILGQVPALRDVATAVLYHHERFDGDGYPAGLAGVDIPRTARALAVLEAFAAMTHDRPYRLALPEPLALDELVGAAGRQFDPEIVALFVEEVRSGRGTPRPELAEAILEALPVVPDVGAGDALEPLAGASTDGLTMLGNQRALQRALLESVAAAHANRSFAVVLLQLEELAQVNAEEGHEAGDRLIQLTARALQRAAARTGGTAFRTSGRRFAVLAALRDQEPDGLRTEIENELTGGARVRTVVVTWRPGERGEDVLERARRSLLEQVA